MQSPCKILFYTENMESILAFFTLFSLLLFASTTDARKDLGEYWRGAVKGEPIPEAIQGLVGTNPISSVSNEKTNCHDEQKEKKSSIKDFKQERIPFIFYNNDGKPTEEEKSFVKHFKPERIPFLFYNNDVKPTEEKSFVKDFEPRPNLSVYHDDAAFQEKKPFVDNFEPRPNVWVYDDDAALKEEKLFVDDFEPRPNLSAYND